MLQTPDQVVGQVPGKNDVTALVAWQRWMAADALSECLRAIDDSSPLARRLSMATVFSVLDHGQDMLVAVAIDADRRHQDMVAGMQTVDLDD